jgi:hypothetical protein
MMRHTIGPDRLDPVSVLMPPSPAPLTPSGFGILTQQQIAHLVALLLDPDSPVNK